MAAKIKTLNDPKTGEQIAPRTFVEAIKTQSDGERLPEILANKASKADVELVNQRVSNLVQNPGEATEGNAELVDIRLGHDGTQYETAGDAVRGQVQQCIEESSKLKSDLTNIYDDNYNIIHDANIDKNYTDNCTNLFVWVFKEPIKLGFEPIITLYAFNEFATNVYFFSKNSDGTFNKEEMITLTPKVGENEVSVPKGITDNKDIYIGVLSNKGSLKFKPSSNEYMMRCDGLKVGDKTVIDGEYGVDFSVKVSCKKETGLVDDLNKKIDGMRNKYVTVDINGNGDYTSVVEAVEKEKEGTVIYIKPGVYDGTIQAFRKRIILIGTDRNKCIIRSTDGRYDYPAINGSCGYLENLTLYHQFVDGVSNVIGPNTNGGYAFHCENEYGLGDTLEFHHCILKSDFFPALGAGLRKDFSLILDSCELINNQINGRGNFTQDGTLGALYFHDSNGEQGDQYISVKNCLLKSNLGNTITPMGVERDTNNNKVYCEFINNVLYDKINKYSNNIWYRGENPFTTGIFVMSIGYGNSNNELNAL